MSIVKHGMYNSLKMIMVSLIKSKCSYLLWKRFHYYCPDFRPVRETQVLMTWKLIIRILQEYVFC